MNQLRAVAIRAIAAIDRGQHAQEALAQTGLSGNERQICADLVYGVLRGRQRLAQELKSCLPAPGKLPALMQIALQMAIYSLVFQDRTQKELVVNDTVAFIKKKLGQKMANVANAALRTYLRQTRAVHTPATLEQWAADYAMPMPIARLWADAYGERAAISLIKRSFARPYAGLRFNRKTSPEASQAWQACSHQPGAIPLTDNGFAFAPGELPRELGGRELAAWQARGALSFQAAGSQIMLAKLGLYAAWRGEPVWDACAGFGGKTMALLEMGAQVKLATDTNFARLAGLGCECAREGYAPPQIALMDAAMPGVAYWDGHILADLPCSGLGVLGRRPDIKQKFSADALANLIVLQEKILLGLARVLQPGRELAIITCTLNPAENEKHVERLQASGLRLLAQWQTPHEHPWLEGMYGARLGKPGVAADC